MTVAELIALLQRQDPDAVVVIEDAVESVAETNLDDDFSIAELQKLVGLEAVHAIGVHTGHYEQYIGVAAHPFPGSEKIVRLLGENTVATPRRD